MKRFKVFFDFEKEEAWLDEMSEKGYRLDSVNPWLCIYTFTKVEEGEFCPKSRIDFRMVPGKDKIEYTECFRGSGWELVYFSNIAFQQYFRQVSPAASDDIFSDKSSVVQRNKRLGRLLLVSSIIFSIFAMTQFVCLTDAIRNTDSLWAVFFAVFGICLAGVAVVTLVAGNRFLSKDMKGLDAVVEQEDNTSAGDKTVRRMVGRMLVCLIISVVAGFAVGSIVSLVTG